MTNIEAMKLALDALFITKEGYGGFQEQQSEAIAALRQAISEAEQFAPEWVFNPITGKRIEPHVEQEIQVEQAISEAEQAEQETPYCKQAPMCKKHCGDDSCLYIEQAEQRSNSERMEPVAEVVSRKQYVGFGRSEERNDILFHKQLDVGTLLYAAPLQREWVSLTQNDKDRLALLCTSAYDVIEQTEAKLKEKNT